MRRSKKGWFLTVSVAIVAVLLVTNGIGRSGVRAEQAGLKIVKKEITSKARFYPYQAGKTYMEVIAVKASDGTVRTALNTCQVCFDSGRGFYTQQGDELVCNNCGNRFKIDEIEKIKFGCNPIPILKENKTDDGKVITVSKAFLDQSQKYFARWKR